MLETIFLNKQFSNPIVLASGILGVTGASLNNVIKNGAGGVTVKSVSKEPRLGHPNPTMAGYEHFFINAVGLSNPGIENAILELKKFKELSNAPLIGSIFAGTPEEFGWLAEKICEAPIDFLEIDISCPNVSREFGDPFAYSVPAVEKITKAVKEKSTVPISVKLSPNAWNIDIIAKAAESSGADAITAVNTISGMTIDVRARRPVLHNKQGGVSGPALFPIALKCVYDIYRAVKIPIIGTGGVTTGENALAMIMAGATLVGVGSAVYFRGVEVFKHITEEMTKIMEEEGIKNLNEIRGCVHL
ncbi:MAG: Dihydroorotate dehydrogenase [Candidatus Magasanikbacteria bacterium GW2011_GWC2_34_16]|uniref:Dihydroorotate dehydrogenase n=2 Tax=Candidatus Magasanikiibacteriota TaxID=1752731 RepID=A0A0G0HFZ6_9BACT|nr:MAG: Dihydroorotate dehydrogenase [Candidatus Magasanikbacteria bacterium GW2011_GWC2_34_16]KKQ41092.1 MAG: Dihydroorotate dehydrogenase [Candidatus Magasanikbacteria bacterium GW2011_GWA2_37_8]